MRVAYVFHDSFPGRTTNTEQLLNSAVRAVRHGVEFDVICPRPVGERRPIPERYAEIAEFYGIDAGAFGHEIRIVELDVPDCFRGNARRGVHDFAAGLRLRGSDEYGLAYARDPAPLLAVTATGLPYMFETYRTDVNLMRSHAAWRRVCYRNARFVGAVAHSHLARQSFLDAGLAPEAVLTAHNGFDVAAQGAEVTQSQARQALKLPADENVVVYTGHVNREKGMDVLVEIAAGIPDASFYLVGAVPSGAGAIWTNEVVARAGATNVTIVDRVPPSEVGRWLAAADVLIVPPTARPLMEFGSTVLPMKTFQYLASGKAIVAGDLPDVGEVLVDGVNARLVPPDDIEAARQALGALLRNSLERERLGAHARLDSKKYTWDARGRRVAQFMLDRVSSIS